MKNTLNSKDQRWIINRYVHLWKLHNTFFEFIHLKKSLIKTSDCFIASERVSRYKVRSAWGYIRTNTHTIIEGLLVYAFPSNRKVRSRPVEIFLFQLSTFERFIIPTLPWRSLRTSNGSHSFIGFVSWKSLWESFSDGVHIQIAACIYLRSFFYIVGHFKFITCSHYHE